MHAQADFFTSLDRPKRPARFGDDDDSLDCLIFELGEADDWLTARELKAILGLNDRTCRALAERSQGRIISGQGGYKLTRRATPEEMQRATAWLESQANKMAKRAGAIRKLWHAAPHQQAPCSI